MKRGPRGKSELGKSQMLRGQEGKRMKQTGSEPADGREHGTE
jgi:hypothetical protein